MKRSDTEDPFGTTPSTLGAECDSATSIPELEMSSQKHLPIHGRFGCTVNFVEVLGSLERDAENPRKHLSIPSVFLARPFGK